MVMVLDAHAAVTPEGKPAAVPIPVALVVVCVILVNGVLVHKLGVLEAALAVTAGFTETSTVNGVPAQLLAVGVMVYLTTPTVAVVLVNVCAMGPVTPVV